jgi:hypothetical protein
LVVTGYGMGGTAGDVDGDGDLDLYVTAFGRSQLFQNRGDGTFADVTDRAGVANGNWGTSAGFADPDRDGDLDLYVANYVDFAFDNNVVCGLKARNLRSYCHPEVYTGLPDRYYRNLGPDASGQPRFEDASAAAGFGSDRGNGLGVLWGDVDADGWPDLYVANDMTPSFLFRNRGSAPAGGAAFEEVGLQSGTALSDLGKPEAGMGVELGDLDGNGHPDLVVTHLDLQTTVLYSNQGGGLFVDARYLSNLAAPSMHVVGFGVVFADLDQDADLDVAVANGHIIHNVELWGTGTTYKQRNQLFENEGQGRFREVEASGLDLVRSSRGMAAGDLDGDGDLDLVVADNNDESELYENVGAAGSWLQVELVGRRSNASGIGTRLELEAGGRRQLREARTASSYLSQGALTIHFGLGAAARADRLTLRWPSGAVQELRDLPINRRLVAVE